MNHWITRSISSGLFQDDNASPAVTLPPYRVGRDRWPLWAAIDTAGTGLLTKAVILWERGLLRRYRRQRSRQGPA